MTNRCQLFQVIPLALLCLPLTQTPATDDASPEKRAQAAFDCLKEQRIDDFAKMMHPESLKQFRKSAIELVDLADKDKKSGEILPMFDGVKDVDGLKKLDETRLFASFLNGIMRNPRVKQALAGAKIQTLGHCGGDKDSTYVVYRSTVTDEGAELVRINAIGLRRDGKTWSLLMLDDMGAMLIGLKQRIKGSFELPDMAAAKAEPLGCLLDDEQTAHVVYNAVMPLGDATFTKVGVLSVKKDDPDWAQLQKTTDPKTMNVLRKRVGLPDKPPA